MNIKQANVNTEILIEKGIIFEEGLNDYEFEKIESKFGVVFPNDLKLFLQNALPISDGFTHWRHGLESEKITENIITSLDWPLDGMIYDVKNNGFWFDQWGGKPKGLSDQINLATKFYFTYPKLIPIYSHRYNPNNPIQAGNRVFSVCQMDIIYYGYDLASYFAKEFKFELPDYFEILTEPKVEIEFWSYWTVYN
jgi:hypothetical protein